MATRRKYKHPQAYRDGGRVPIDNIIVTEPMPAEPTASADVPPPLAPSDNALLKQAEAQRRAEEMHRQAAAQQPQTIEQIIDSIPDLSDHKRQFLKDHPEMLSRPELVTRNYKQALSEGLEDDSPQLYRRILDGVHMDTVQQVERAKQNALASVAAPGAPPVIAPAPAAPQPQRKSTPAMTAPVSRSAPGLSGARPVDYGKITLSPEEREMARAAITDEHMSNAEKEALYAKGKLAMMKRKANGTYDDR